MSPSRYVSLVVAVLTFWSSLVPSVPVHAIEAPRSEVLPVFDIVEPAPPLPSVIVLPPPDTPPPVPPSDAPLSVFADIQAEEYENSSPGSRVALLDPHIAAFLARREAEPEPPPFWCEKYGQGCSAVDGGQERWRATERWRGEVESYAGGCPDWAETNREEDLCWHGGMTVDMVLAVIFCESHGEEDAYNSGNNDTGLFQFIPSTWRTSLGRISDESWRRSEMWQQPYTVERWVQAGFNLEILESEHPEGDWRKDGRASIWMAYWLSGTEHDRNAGWNHWVCWRSVKNKF